MASQSDIYRDGIEKTIDLTENIRLMMRKEYENV